MNKNLENSELAKISSYDELKKAQRRVRREIGKAEHAIVRNYDITRERFSVKTLVATLVEKIDDVQTIVRYAVNGFQYVSSIVKERREERKEEKEYRRDEKRDHLEDIRQENRQRERAAYNAYYSEMPYYEHDDD